MPSNTITSKELIGMRVVGGKSGEKQIGKVRHLVFHPKERRVIGFIVKRPDLLLMFHRADQFVALDSYEVVDGRVCVAPGSDAVDKGACKRLGVDWDRCLLWSGMPIVTESGREVGLVGTVTFNSLTGSVVSVTADRGATSKALLGTVEIPVESIKGFRFGIGSLVTEVGHEGETVEEEDERRGAILVADEVLDIAAEGGIAEKAGAAVGKVRVGASEAVEKGTQALNDQIDKTEGMFTNFKDEYRKARHEGEEDAEPKERRAIADVVDEQVDKTQGMFAAFKEEYDKASKAESSSDSSDSDGDDTVVEAIGKQVKKSRGMFAAFKEEYDKARNE